MTLHWYVIQCSDKAHVWRAMSRAAIGSRLNFGPNNHKGIRDVMGQLRTLEDPGV